MYGLSDCVDLLDNPPTKASWKRTVNRAVCTYWAGRIQSIVPLYPSLKWLTLDATVWPKRHSLLEFSGDLREVPRIAVLLKIVTGTYILPTIRHLFNQNQVDPLCLLCKGANETIAYFLLDCTTLEITRQRILKRGWTGGYPIPSSLPLSPHFPPPPPPLPSPFFPTSLPLSDFSLPLIKFCSYSRTTAYICK